MLGFQITLWPLYNIAKLNVHFWVFLGAGLGAFGGGGVSVNKQKQNLSIISY